MFVRKKTVFSFIRHAVLDAESTHSRHPEFSSGSMWMLVRRTMSARTVPSIARDETKPNNRVQHDVKRRWCFGRSMIEMLGVLALVGILSIGGITLYRRAVNNHHANTILDDVNRFAFVITEHGGYPEGEDIPKGDFKESGIYTLTGHQAYAGQYSITASNVPKGICEILIDKGIVDYKVGVVTASEDVENEILYDTLHTDLCQETNDVAFYFGDVSGVCNTDENDETECTTNADCCGGEFCVYVNATDADKIGNGNGKCKEVNYFGFQETTLSDGSHWVRSTQGMNGWTAQGWCAALGLRMVTAEDLNCSGFTNTSTCADTSPAFELGQVPGWGIGYYWLSVTTGSAAPDIDLPPGARNRPVINGAYLARNSLTTLCH